MNTVTVKEGDVPSAIAEILDDLAETWVMEAQRVCPVVTGYLRDHIAKVASGPDGAEVVAAAEYASYVEFGRHGRPARAYMRRGLDMAVLAMARGLG